MIKVGSPQSIRHNGYDLLKIFLACQVICSHSWELLGIECFSVFNRSPGNVAVHAFFVLSGYFITMSMKHSKSTGDYIWKRLVRLLPAYLIALLASKGMASLCNGFVDLPVPYITNGSVWTLYYEIVLYICVMLLDSWGLLKKDIIGGLCVVLFLAAILHISDSDPLYSILLPMLCMFAAGSLIYLSKDEKNLIKMGPVGIVGLCCVQFFPDMFSRIGSAIPLIYGPSVWEYSAFLVYLLSMPSAVLWIGSKMDVPVRHIPDISYGLYLFGWPVQQTIIFLFIQNKHLLMPMELFVISSAATAVLACLSWYGVEKQVLKAKSFYWQFTNKMRHSKHHDIQSP